MLLNEGEMVIIGSSTSKNLGPRKGSIGYIIDYLSYNTYKLHVTKWRDHEIGKAFRELILCSYNVAFTKYGLEKKDRLEKRDVTQVFPIPHIKGEVTESAITSLIANLPAIEASIEQLEIPICHPLVVMVPSPNGRNCFPKKSKNEITAWLLSKTQGTLSEYIGAFYRNIISNCRPRPINIDMVLLELIVSARDNKTAFDQLVNLLTDEISFDKTVEDIVKLIALVSQSKHDNNFSYALSHNSIFDPSGTFMTTDYSLLEDLFVSNIFNNKKKIVLSKYNAASPQNIFIKKIQTIIDILIHKSNSLY